MITLNAEINVIEKSGDITYISSSASKSNISSNINSILGVEKETESPFILDVSVLDNGDEYYDNVNYFIGGIPSNDNGDFSSSYVIVFSGSIKDFTIVFDKKRNAYPKEITVNYTVFSNDDTVFTYKINSVDAYNTITLTISNWSLPNSPFVIQGIYNGITINVGERVLNKMEIPCQTYDNYKEPFYGIYSSSGSLIFNDVDGEIKDYYDLKLLNSGIKVYIYLKNNLYGVNKKVGDYITGKWDYDSSNKNVTVEITDKLYKLQYITIPEISKSFDITVYDYYLSILQYFPSDMTIYTNRSAISKMSNIEIPIFCCESRSLWDSINEICQTCMLTCNNGRDYSVVIE